VGVVGAGCAFSGVWAAIKLLLEELASGLNFSNFMLLLGVIAAARFLNGDAPDAPGILVSSPSKREVLAGVASGGFTVSRGEAEEDSVKDGEDCASAAFCAAGLVAFILSSSTFSLG